MTSTSVSPATPATREDILGSPSVMFIPRGDIIGDPTKLPAERVYVTVTDGVIEMDVTPYKKELSTANVGTTYQTASGHTSMLLGVYIVMSATSNLVFLRLLSNRPCTEYGWCSGHEAGDEHATWHCGPGVDLFVFDGHEADYPTRVICNQIVKNGEPKHGICIEYDLELDDSELLTLASELETVAAKIRGLL